MQRHYVLYDGHDGVFEEDAVQALMWVAKCRQVFLNTCSPSVVDCVAFAESAADCDTLGCHITSAYQ